MSEHVQPQLSGRDRALLAALADGSLHGRRRERAEARVRELPDGARLLERQRRVRRALGGGCGPPPTLIVPAVPERRAPHWAPRAVVAAAVASLLIALALGGRGTDPSPIARAALLAQRSATAGPPASEGKLLAAEVDGVAFPDWSRDFGWHAAGPA